MRTSAKRLVAIAFTVGIYGLSVLGFGQSNENGEKSLQGKWILENISVLEENGKKIPFNADSVSRICCEVPTGLEIQQEDITFVWKESTQTVKSNRVLRGNSICIPHCAEWKIAENQLLLQWTQDVESPENESEVKIIVLTYKLK